DQAVALARGAVDGAELEALGEYGAGKVLHATNEKLNQGIIQEDASVIARAMEEEKCDVLVVANSSLGTPVAARVATRIGAALASNVVALPDTSSGFVVKKSIYSGKAFAFQQLNSQKKVLVLRKNAVDAKEVGGAATVTQYAAQL